MGVSEVYDVKVGVSNDQMAYAYQVLSETTFMVLTKLVVTRRCYRWQKVEEAFQFFTFGCFYVCYNYVFKIFRFSKQKQSYCKLRIMLYCFGKTVCKFSVRVSLVVILFTLLVSTIVYKINSLRLLQRASVFWSSLKKNFIHYQICLK